MAFSCRTTNVSSNEISKVSSSSSGLNSAYVTSSVATGVNSIISCSASDNLVTISVTKSDAKDNPGSNCNE